MGRNTAITTERGQNQLSSDSYGFCALGPEVFWNFLCDSSWSSMTSSESYFGKGGSLGIPLIMQRWE